MHDLTRGRARATRSSSPRFRTTERNVAMNSRTSFGPGTSSDGDMSKCRVKAIAAAMPAAKKPQVVAIAALIAERRTRGSGATQPGSSPKATGHLLRRGSGRRRPPSAARSSRRAGPAVYAARPGLEARERDVRAGGARPAGNAGQTGSPSAPEPQSVTTSASVSFRRALPARAGNRSSAVQ